MTEPDFLPTYKAIAASLVALGLGLGAWRAGRAILSVAEQRQSVSITWCAVGLACGGFCLAFLALMLAVVANGAGLIAIIRAFQ